MKLKVDKKESISNLTFIPEKDHDIFLLGQLASNVGVYSIKALTDDDQYNPPKIIEFSIDINELLKFLEQKLNG